MRNSTFVYKNSWGKSHVLERINRGNCEDRFDPPQVRGRGTKEREVLGHLIKRRPTTIAQFQFHYRGSDQSFRASFVVGDYVLFSSPPLSLSLSFEIRFVETICHLEWLETQISLIRFSSRKERVSGKRLFDFLRISLILQLGVIYSKDYPPVKGRFENDSNSFFTRQVLCSPLR